MKLLITCILCVVGLVLGGCQNQPHRDDFTEKTHRTYNPETGSFEQAPPWGKQSNKSGDE